jgi:hypothetical protein
MRLTEDGKLCGVNTCLWEAMVHIEAERDDWRGKAYGELLRQLGETACMSRQEIGIEPTPQGWVIHINACDEEGKVAVLIPSDRRKPVKVLFDTRAGDEGTWLGRLALRILKFSRRL